MALDEADRFRITTKLADTLGQDDAGFSRVDAQFDQVDAKLSDLSAELHKTLRVHTLALITTMVAMNTMMVSLVALLR